MFQCFVAGLDLNEDVFFEAETYVSFVFDLSILSFANYSFCNFIMNYPFEKNHHLSHHDNKENKPKNVLLVE